MLGRPRSTRRWPISALVCINLPTAVSTKGDVYHVVGHATLSAFAAGFCIKLHIHIYSYIHINIYACMYISYLSPWPIRDRVFPRIVWLLNFCARMDEHFILHDIFCLLIPVSYNINIYHMLICRSVTVLIPQAKLKT